MRVVHYMESFSRLSQTFIYDYIVEMARQGLECHVVTQVRENARERPFERVHETGIPGKWNVSRVVRRAAARLSSDPDRNYRWDMLRERAEESIRRISPDVIHAHFGPAAAIVAPVARAMGIPLVAAFYGYDASRLLRDPKWLETYGDLWEIAYADVVLSEDMKNRLEDAGCPPDRTKVVHLGKYLDDYVFRLPERPVRRIVSVGRLVEKKGALDLVMAVRQLVERGDAIELEIVGDGPLRPSIQNHIDTAGLNAHVTLAGALPHRQVVERLASADAFALCSKTAANGDQEGTPTVLLEAQALGLPCISTRHAGIPEIIPEANHWLLSREGDVDGIAACITSLQSCTVEDLQSIATKGRRKIEREFDLTTEVSKLRDLYALHAGSEATP